MEGISRWSVTYTKHIRQKRKVYQDGLLELHGSTGKVMLYDDSEKLLYCKVLKKDEVVRPGETLTFDTYLIDIGDPEGDHKTSSNFNSRGENENIVEKSSLYPRRTFRKNSVFAENKKLNSGQNKTLSSNLSPSQKIIREFKKSELHKYGALQSSPGTPKYTVTEWQVLYTAQITQKAKKYHDGFLRLQICGSQGRQAMLYDSSKKLLDGRFLKKDEEIGSGESLTFDSYLVDVGEPEGSHEPEIVLNVSGSDCKVVGKAGIVHGEQDKSKANQAVVRKWNVLYSTQMTQKLKKYQSGILRLTPCGSYQMQVILLNEEGSTLSRKFLAIADDIRTGCTIELPKYLVEIGEPWTDLEGQAKNSACMGKKVDSYLDRIRLSKRAPITNPSHEDAQINGLGKEVVSDSDNINLSGRVTMTKPSHGGTQNNECSGKEVDPNLDNVSLSRRVTIHKPLRGTHEILSILKKPITEESIALTREEPVAQGLELQSSDLAHLGIEVACVPQLYVSEKSAIKDHKYEFKVVNNDTDATHICKGEIPDLVTLHTDPTFDFVKLEHPDKKAEPEPEPEDSIPLGFNPGSGTSNISGSKFYLEHADGSTMDSNSFIERLQAYSRSDAVIFDFSEENQLSGASKPHQELISLKQIDECPMFDLGI